MMSVNLTNTAIFNIHGVESRCIINGINQSKAGNLLQNADLNEKSRTL